MQRFHPGNIGNSNFKAVPILKQTVAMENQSRIKQLDFSPTFKEPPRYACGAQASGNLPQTYVSSKFSTDFMYKNMINEHVPAVRFVCGTS